MDIKITYQSLKQFLDTPAGAEEIAAKVSLCGPTFDRIHQEDDDFVFDIEAITNRIDSASVQGVAREAAAILNQFDIEAALKNDPYKEGVDLLESLPPVFDIEVTDPQLTPRFTAVALQNISIHESPAATKKFLELCGQRPINNVVDITNELTLLYGLPSHIFDLDKIKKQYLSIRTSKKGESLQTLDGAKNELKGGDIIIEDGDGRIIDLCGIMGGSLAEVDEKTKNILLIVPTYLPKSIRKTSLYLQKRTLAAQIYEKQPDTELTLPVISQAIKLFHDRADATPVSKIFDYYPGKLEPKTVDLDLNWLDQFVGIALDSKRVVTILNDLGFQTTIKENKILGCQVPSYRYHDINIREDLAEEIARVYGYFRLPSVLPCVNLPSSTPDILLSSELKAKKYLSDIGFSEIYNSSLISLDIIEKSLQKPADHLKLVNALSQEYEYLRLSLLPSLISSLKNNQGKVPAPINIYELSNVYAKRSKGKVPDEISTLAILSTEDFSKTKGVLESLFDHLNTEKYSFLASKSNTDVFLTGKTADIIVGGTLVGHIGHLKPQILREMGIETDSVAVEINFLKLVACLRPGYVYTPISLYPDVLEDITVSSTLPVGEIIDRISSLDPLISSVKYLTTYKNSHTFKVSFTSQKSNLDQSTINAIKEKILSSFK